MIHTEYMFKQEQLHELIADLLGIYKNRVMFANRQINTTNVPFYVVVQRGAAIHRGTSRGMSDTKEVEYSATIGQVPYTVQLIGNNAALLADKLRAALRLTKALDRFKAMGVGVLTISATRDLSFAINSGYEERAQFDIVLSQTTIVSSEQYAIMSAEIELIVEQ